jgi:peptide/nickel transport system substrate-binding protein
LRVSALVCALALALAACGSSSKNSKAPGGAAEKSSASTTTTPVQQGGTLTLGAEQDGDCWDWLGSCSGSSWSYWDAEIQTIPTAFNTAGSGGDLTQVPGAVLAGMPTVTFSPVETITYKINPAAVWSDGVQITCDDFAYTADQEQHSSDIYDRTGYTGINTVTCPDPKTVVVTYKKGETFAGWQQLFASTVGVMPSHILKGKNRDNLMKNGYSWSGGPWLAKWDKGVSVTLTPNPKYWGEKPHLDKVVFKVVQDTNAEFQDFKSGQVDAIYPQPQIDVINAISAGLGSDTNSVYNANTASLEALWLNNAKFPFTDVAVRQAFAYALNRDQLVNQLFGKLGVTKASQSLNPPVLGPYSDQTAYSMYNLDLSKVNSLMTGAGWKKGADGYWAKNGKEAAFVFNSTTGNARRGVTETVLQSQLKTAGFKMTIQNKDPGDLFGTILPAGDYVVALYAQSLTALTPGLCTIMCSKNIPSAANQNSGENWTRTNVPDVDKQEEIVDTSTDDNARKAAAAQGDRDMAAAQVTLPLDPLPDICLWHKKVVGPIGDNAIESMFWNLNQWGLQQ